MDERSAKSDSRRRLWLRSLTICAGALFLTGRALALDPGRQISQYGFKKYDLEDGLPQSTVEAFGQTADGYLWLATQSGLARFDGLRVRSYSKATPTLMKYPHLVALAAGKNDSLWIGGHGAGLHHYQQGRFERIAVPVVNSSLPYAVSSVAIAPDESIWIGWYGGLIHARPDGTVLARHDKELPSPIVTAVLVSRSGAVWAGTAAGLVRLDRLGMAVYGAGAGMPPGIRRLVEDRFGTIWIGTEEGLYALRQGRIQRRAGPLGKASITALGTDSDGSLWVGTLSGAWRLNPQQIVGGPAAYGLAGEWIRSFFEDREGSFWVGTITGAIQLRDTLVVPTGKPEGLQNEVVFSLYEDSATETLYVGTDAGLAIMRHGRVQKWITKENGLPSTLVNTLAATRDGGLWIGTPQGLCVYRKDALRCFDSTNGMTHRGVTSIIADPDGSVWVGTVGGITHLINERVIGTYTTLNSDLATDSILTLQQATDGGLWVTGRGSLQHLRDGRFATVALVGEFDSNGRFVRANTIQTDRRQFWAATYSILEEADGSLWLSTNLGLLRKKGEQWTRFDLNPKAANDMIYRVIADDHGFFWAATLSGIIRVRKTELDAYAESRQPFHAEIIDSVSGMRSRECNSGNPAAIRTADGALLFGTIKGIARIDPARRLRNSAAPTVMIEEAWADGRRLSTGGNIDRGTSRVMFRFTASTFVAAERVHFKYRLEGFDSTWIDGGTSRTATYTALPPGTYRFRVTAANAAGVWNEAGASFSLVRRPAFRETILFFVSIGAAVLLLVAAIVKARLHLHEKRELVLVRRVEEQTVRLRDTNVELLSAKRGAEEIAEANAELSRHKQVILSSTSDGIFELDEHGNATFMNVAAAGILGAIPAVLLGHRPHDFIHPADETSAPEDACRVCSRDLPDQLRQNEIAMFRTHDGRTIPVEYTATTLRTDSGAARVVVTFRDITERRAVEQFKDELITTVSHELRTPLTAIRGALGLLTSGRMGSLQPKGQRMLEIAVQNTDRLVRLINDFLDLERIGSGAAGMIRILVDVDEVITRAVEIIQPIADEAGVRIAIEPVRQSLAIDSDRILQTLVNLISNSIKFSPRQSTITVSGCNVDGVFVFRVADQGRGIPPAKLGTIFKRFEQIQTSDSRDKGGTGLGLAICHSIVSGHGGRIWAESDGHSGSVFQFTIPLDAAPTPANG